MASANGNSYLSIGKAAALLGCSVATLRLWESKGLIRSYRTCNGFGHRRFLLSELKAQALSVNGEEVTQEENVCVYVRVSSTAQQRSGSLERQLGRMLSEVAQRENVEEGGIRVFKDIASAFGTRKGLNKLTDAMLAGEVSKVYVEHQDRLSRVPALSRLLEHLASRNNVEIVALDREEENPDELKNSMLELVEFVTVLANRTNARKQAERKRKRLSAETIQFIREELAQGRGLSETVEKANRLGHRTERGGEISYHVARTHLVKLLDTVAPIETSNSFEAFLKVHVKKKSGGKVQAASIHRGYRDYCYKQSVEPLTKMQCGKYLRKSGFRHVVFNAYIHYVDVTMVGYPDVLPNMGRGIHK